MLLSISIIFVFSNILSCIQGFHLNPTSLMKRSLSMNLNQPKQLSKLISSIMIATFALQFNSPNIIHADSRLNAPSSAGTRVNSDAESLLRYGLPINNKEIRDIQKSIESSKINIKTRRVSFAKSDILNAKDILNKNKTQLLKSVSSNHLKEAEESFNRINEDIQPLIDAFDAEQKSGSGSLQERKGINIFNK